MPAILTITVPDELAAELSQAAVAVGSTPEAVAADRIAAGLAPHRGADSAALPAPSCRT
jgi:predicted transcriptional regulator